MWSFRHCHVTSYLIWRYATAIDSFIATSMVCAAFSTSGGYLNPVLATSLKFGCRGHTPMEVHISLYLLWQTNVFYISSIFDPIYGLRSNHKKTSSSNIYFILLMISTQSKIVKSSYFQIILKSNQTRMKSRLLTTIPTMFSANDKKELIFEEQMLMFVNL